MNLPWYPAREAYRLMARLTPDMKAREFLTLAGAGVQDGYQAGRVSYFPTTPFFVLWRDVHSSKRCATTRDFRDRRATGSSSWHRLCRRNGSEAIATDSTLGGVI
jgi:hypothetical protein